jgi:hypothetical protein
VEKFCFLYNNRRGFLQGADMKLQVRTPESKTIQSGLVLSSEPLGWKHVSLTKWQGVAPQEAYEPALSQHLIVIHTTPGPVKVFERGEGIRCEGLQDQGISIFSLRAKRAIADGRINFPSRA